MAEGPADCRQMPTRTCPVVYGPGGCGVRPCARHESRDENPWMSEVVAGTEPLQVRPRYGKIRRRAGGVTALVFHPADGQPGVFVALEAGSLAPVTLAAGDAMTVDVIGPGQSVTFGMPPAGSS